MNELSALIHKTRNVIPDAIKTATVGTVGVVVDESPKFSGQLRASTRVGLNGADLSKVIAPVYERDAVSNPEGISKGKAAVAVTRFHAGDTIYISNDLDYAGVQEYERGQLMFTKAAAMFPQLLDRAVDAAQ